MWKFKFGLWAVVLITSVFSFSACGDDDDNDTFVPPANIEVALKQLYRKHPIKYTIKKRLYLLSS